MIRINLLAVERERAKKKIPFQAGQKLVVACSLILVAGVLLVGWRFWALRQASAALDAEISAAQQETTRLRSIIEQVQEFEQQRTELQQRVALIEELRNGQTGPVHMLDELSRSLPGMVWLTEVRQAGRDVVITGESLSVTALTDFVSNLQSTGYFERSIDIVNSTTVPVQQAPGELIRFTLRASFLQPTPPPPAPGPGGRRGATGNGGGRRSR
jgi:type IV pilus assembly protein PilN